MPHIRFTENIQRHVECPSADVPGNTVIAALESFFHQNPRARGYILDDQASLRKHMNIFINGRQIADRQTLSDAVTDADTIDVMQALSGG